MSKIRYRHLLTKIVIMLTTRSCWKGGGSCFSNADIAPYPGRACLYVNDTQIREKNVFLRQLQIKTITYVCKNKLYNVTISFSFFGAFFPKNNLIVDPQNGQNCSLSGEREYLAENFISAFLKNNFEVTFLSFCGPKHMASGSVIFLKVIWGLHVGTQTH